MCLAIPSSNNYTAGKRDKYRCRINAFLHIELGVGDVGNKEPGIATFSKILKLSILALQHLSLISLKGAILDITASEQAISSLKVQISLHLTVVVL